MTFELSSIVPILEIAFSFLYSISDQFSGITGIPPTMTIVILSVLGGFAIVSMYGEFSKVKIILIIIAIIYVFKSVNTGAA